MALAKHGPFMALLKGWDSEELFLAEERVRALVESDGWPVICELIEAAASHKRDEMEFAADVWDQAAYARQIGLIRGLDSALVVAEAVLIRAEQVHKTLQEQNEQRRETPVA